MEREQARQEAMIAIRMMDLAFQAAGAALDLAAQGPFAEGTDVTIVAEVYEARVHLNNASEWMTRQLKEGGLLA